MKTLTPNKTISVLELAALLCANLGVTFITFIANTKADSLRLKATDGSGRVNPHYKNILKRTTVNVMVGADYEKRVNKVRDQQGMEARDIGERKNGVRIPNTPFVLTTTNKVCLSCEVRSVKNEATYVVASTGAALDYENDIKPFKGARSGEISYCDYGLDTIESITLLGNTFTIDQTTYAEAQAHYAQLRPEPVPASNTLPDTTPAAPAARQQRQQRDEPFNPDDHWHPFSGDALGQD